MRARNKGSTASDFDLLRTVMALMGGMLLFQNLTDWASVSVFQILMGTYFLILAIGGAPVIVAVFRAGFAVSRLAGRLFSALTPRSRGAPKAPQPAKRLSWRPGDDTPVFVPAAGERPVPTLDELAEMATVVLDADSDLDDEPFVRGPEHTNLDMVRQLFGHCRCDWFAVALSIVTGWEIVAAGSPGERSVHRLVRNPQGRLIDVYGYVTLEELRERYGFDDLQIFANLDTEPTYGLTDEDIPFFVAAMLYLPEKPFTCMKESLSIWVRFGGAAPLQSPQRSGH